MGDIIALLPDHVANQIAAGEVVQRPASVVKELMENAVDAGATEIHLIIQDAGKGLIRVVDNGKGMTYADARTAFERHATSKIRKAEDLFALHTMGFRGEALASISAVAQVELKTRQKADDLGAEVRIEGSKVLYHRPCQTASGTSISVKNLFYNIPARRQFLKSDNVEKRHIIDAFEYVALANPEMGFRFMQDETEVFHLLPGNLRQRIVGIFSKRYNEKLVPVEEATDLVKLRGFVLKPEFARKTRGEQFFFVNDRFIKNNYLHHAVSHAFDQLIRPGEHPSYFLFMDIDPRRIDVNIHPTKTEVKFDDEKSIYAIIRSAVKHALGQFNIAPSLDFNSNVGDIPVMNPDREIVPPLIRVDPNFNPFDEPTKKGKNLAGSPGQPFQKTAVDPNWQKLYADSPPPDKLEIPSNWNTADETQSTEQPCFQLNRQYIVTKAKNSLIVVNQQRAHQRVMYEYYLHLLNRSSSASQQLLFPHKLPLKKTEIGILQSVEGELHRMGFQMEPDKDGGLSVFGIPVHLHESDIDHLVESLIEDVKKDSDVFNNQMNHALALSLCRSTAIRNGQILKEDEMNHLMNELFACEMPYHDAIGRPTLVRIDGSELAHKFE